VASGCLPEATPLLNSGPEQEIHGVAIPEVEATFAEEAAKPDIATPGLFSVDHIGSGEGIRAAEVVA
jgi:hypothetical protein